MANTAQESVWLRQLIAECTNSSTFEDNRSANSITKNPQFRGHTKHINIKHHLFKN